MLVVKYVEPWAVTHQQRWHAEALQTYGERVVVRHRWNIRDYAEGRVGRCISCSAGVRLNEKQRVRVIGASAGTFTLTFAGQTTSPIPFYADSSDLQLALESLPVNNVGDVSVTGDSQSGLLVEFLGQWAYNESIPNMTVDDSSLNPNAGSSVELIQVQSGSGGSNIESRYAAVYKQSGDSWCTACYGVGFEGGFEAVIYVTYAMIRDQMQETTRTVGGAYQAENPTAQFSFEPQVEEFDLVARVEAWESDNITPKTVRGRFVLREVQPVTVRTGPGTPSDSLAVMPENLRTEYQIPDREWVVGQKTQIDIVPFEHAWNMVPLTREEERLVEEGLVPERRWFEKATVEVPFAAQVTNP